ncbi:XrtA/PEP-CTERM system-associated ATPase [Amphiplicatus metriothermophilus]|uniref:Putative secretion ATPase, PEP-CTERM locus subfamily n=1 Tax=Amphiplicatus metriothermophilus TaxID=1519374 RepID=A0A239PTN2_9PROT|nr:XrtA/PEP-CTERM system-associated ATPase [Amphiplicatus metriothermophilus]MBB5519197.1 putative secretion ATPase (PEP-CTERM system associated) [Amphiplicatus metriothermophilus]SNT73266.1 putative secretion ATPase, PEP-CTERM locus subfamily [Amphiplicatus metriothermophilus]
MYEERFRLSGSPFRLNPDPKFFFGSRSHNKAMAYLHYGLRQGEGFIVITGEIGAGKSMLIGHLLDQLDRSNVVAAHLLISTLEPDALMAHILSAYRIEPAGSGRSAEIEAFEDFLFDQMNRGRRVLLIVDEAQNLPPKTIEELRMLSNMDYEGTPLFQVFLVGQPEFRGLLARPEMEQFRQRVIASYHLEPLAAPETKAYILHRLSVVGWADDPAIGEDAFAAIHAATDGVPRKINTLCNRLFLHCALEDVHAIDAALVERVRAEMSAEAFSAEETRAEEAAERKEESRPVEAQAQTQTQAQGAAGGRGVVVQLPAARKLDAPRADDSRRAGAAPAKRADEASSDVASAESMTSVLDRLRARQARESGAPRPATLEDVAEAIAAAGLGTAAPAEDDEPASEPPPAPGAKGWREGFAAALGAAREELKSAHGEAARLRRELGEMARRRAARRAELAERLERASALLACLRGKDSDAK